MLKQFRSAGLPLFLLKLTQEKAGDTNRKKEQEMSFFWSNKNIKQDGKKHDYSEIYILSMLLLKNLVIIHMSKNTLQVIILKKRYIDETFLTFCQITIINFHVFLGDFNRINQHKETHKYKVQWKLHISFFLPENW